MTNGEKYKTIEGRVAAFRKWCNEQECSTIVAKCSHEKCILQWLELEADDESVHLLPCPFCGSPVMLIKDTQTINAEKWYVDCTGCMYEYADVTKEDVVAKHNRVAKAIRP